jgi:hypothetical protein
VRYQSAEELQLDLEELAREQKMAQSSVGLRAFMHKAFEPEITAWKEAQDQGHTLMDFVMHQQQTAVLDHTNPVSESEVEYLPEDEEYDDDDSAVEDAVADAGPTRPLQALLGVIEEPQEARETVRTVAMTPSASIVVQPAMRVSQSIADNSAFPKAPKEWLPASDPVEPVVEPVLRHWRNVKIGAAVVLVAIVLIAVVFSGGSQHAAAPPPAPADARPVMPMTVTLPDASAPPIDSAAAAAVGPEAPPIDAPPPIQQRGASPKGDNKLPPRPKKP